MKTTVPEEIVNALYRKRSELHMISAYYAMWGDIQIWYAGTRLLITTYWPHYLESFDLPMNVSWKENTLPGPRVQRHHTKNEEELRNDQTARSAHSQLGEVLTMTLEIQRMELISVCKKSEVDSPNVKSVFIVHGHDDGMKQSVARTLEKLGLMPIILHEQPDSGKTIIEKFVRDADVGFAVVLLSPDDMGYKKDDGAEKAKPRARQNVILELGYFVGRLGRDKVMALKRGDDLELPSDLSGVVYTPFDDHGAWEMKLLKELKAAGYNVDANHL